MNCKEIDALLDGHGVRALSAAARAEVSGHLGQCRRCADAWLSHEALAGEERAAVPAGLLERVTVCAIGRAADGVAPPARRHVAGRFGLAAAAGLAAIVLTGLWVAGQDAPAPQSDLAHDSAESSPPGLLGDTPIYEPQVPGYTAGIHYELLAEPAPTTAADGQVEVCEFFMFGCIHCFNFEAELTPWVESRSETIDFVRVPALFNDLARLHAQAYYTAEALDALDAIVEPFYSAFHVRGHQLSTVEEIRIFFVQHGVDGARFDATFNSAGVQASLRRAAELNRLYGVTATPSIGINGQYVTNPSMTGSTGEMLELVDALVAASDQSCDGQNSGCPARLAPSGFPGGAGPRLETCEPSEIVARRIGELERRLSSELLLRYTEQNREVIATRQELERLESQARDECVERLQ